VLRVYTHTYIQIQYIHTHVTRDTYLYYIYICTFICEKSSGSGGLTKGVAFVAQKGFAPGRGERDALFMRRIWPGPLNFLQRRRSKNKYILSVKKFVGVRTDNGAGDCTHTPSPPPLSATTRDARLRLLRIATATAAI